MLADQDRIFRNLVGKGPCALTEAKKRGDWDHTLSLLQKGPDWMINEVKQSGLKGRGGAGFSTGRKWSFVAQNKNDKPVYLVVNGDESEPGTCKDRDLLRFEPHKIIEGALLAGFAIGAHVGYVYIRGEYLQGASILEMAIEEAYVEGFLGKNALKSGWDFDLYIHMGAGAYICGEETALLESLEGKKGFPRFKPPYPAHYGLFGCPTLIQNIETIATIPTLLRRGAEWFSGLGRAPHSTGTRIFSISGTVHKPCNVEEEMGIPLRELVDRYAGGIEGGWDNLQAVIPGGSSSSLLPKPLCEGLTMDIESLAKVHSSLGTAAVIVMNKSVDIVKAITNISRFYMHESCGQCSPCREGTGWIWRLLDRIAHSKGLSGDIDLLLSITEGIEGRTICCFGESASWPIQGLIRHFRHELEQRLVPNGQAS